MKASKALCLNMIVKNETNLERCLTAAAPHISCWVIGDTGSTDGTQEFVCSFFAERHIPGELHSFPWSGKCRSKRVEFILGAQSPPLGAIRAETGKSCVQLFDNQIGLS